MPVTLPMANPSGAADPGFQWRWNRRPRAVHDVSGETATAQQVSRWFQQERNQRLGNLMLHWTLRSDTASWWIGNQQYLCGELRISRGDSNMAIPRRWGFRHQAPKAAGNHHQALSNTAINGYHQPSLSTIEVGYPSSRSRAEWFMKFLNRSSLVYARSG